MQTIEASTVDRLSYGDCKALSNYMKSLLDVAGIKSFYTLVMAGDDSPLIKEDFPSNQFNHAILCVPMGRDTIWLECTSQNIPFGYIGTFTDDRKVLVLNEAGGRIVSTKRYSIEDNNQIRSASVELGPTGNANATVRTDYKGTLYDGISAVLHMDEKDRLKFVQSRIAIPSFNLISFSHKEQRNIVPVITENLNLSLLNYGTIIGNRILINPNLMTRFGKLPYRTKDRKSVISIRRPYIEKDTIILKVPVNYKMDPVPEKRSVISKFGEYTVIITCNKNVIIYSRLFKFFNGNYPVSDYNGFVDFCEKVSASDERKIVLVKSI